MGWKGLTSLVLGRRDSVAAVLSSGRVSDPNFTGRPVTKLSQNTKYKYLQAIALRLHSLAKFRLKVPQTGLKSAVHGLSQSSVPEFTISTKMIGLVWLLLYAHRHRSVLGAAGHIILTPANQLMEE
jgi:hypothetical protein